MQDFRMPDSYYDPPDYSYTDAQESAIEEGRWNPDAESWEEFLTDLDEVDREED